MAGSKHKVTLSVQVMLDITIDVEDEDSFYSAREFGAKHARLCVDHMISQPTTAFLAKNYDGNAAITEVLALNVAGVWSR